MGIYLNILKTRACSSAGFAGPVVINDTNVAYDPDSSFSTFMSFFKLNWREN